MEDDHTTEMIRSALDPVVEQAPATPEFDEILTLVPDNRERRLPRLQLGAVVVCVSAFVIVIVGSSIWFTRSGEGDDASLDPTSTLTTQPAITTTEPPVVTPVATAPELQLQYGLRRDWLPMIGVTWTGLPDTVAYVTVASYEGATNPRPREVVGGTSSFEMPKPDWTRYSTFTAHDEDGTPLIVEERLLDGGTCSAGGLNPNPAPNPDLPDTVDETRVYLFGRAVACRYSDIERAATGEALFFGVSADRIAAELRELDRRRGIMLRIHTALLFDAKEEQRDGRSVYVFTSGDVELVIDSEGQLIEASA